MSYYKFKERENPKQSMIDWASITKNISEGIEKEAERRDTLKGELESTFVSNLNEVQDFSTGLDPTRNQFIQEQAGQARDFLYEMNRLLKAGQLDPTKYKVVAQGAMDTFTLMNENAQQFNDKLAKIAEAGGNINQYIAENAADLTQLHDKRMIFDPETGVGSFAKLDKDGNVIRSSITPVTKINNLFESEMPEFDMTAAISNAVKNLKDYVVAEGPYRSVSDVRQDKETYDKWVESRKDAIMAEAMGGLLIADYYMGMQVTDDPQLAAKNPGKYILATKEGGDLKFNLTDTQKGVIRDRIGYELEMAISSEEKQTPVSAAVLARADARRDKKESVDVIVQALSGNEGSMRSLARLAGFRDLRIMGDEIQIIGSDGQTTASILYNTNDGIRGVGQELAAAIGINPNEFDRYYKGSDQVNVQAVSGFKPYNTPAQPVSINAGAEAFSLPEFYVTKDPDTQKETVELRSGGDTVAGARQAIITEFAKSGIYDIVIQEDGNVLYKGKDMGNIADGRAYVRNVENAVNAEAKGGIMRKYN